LNGLEQYHLKKYCRKYGLDYQEIDNTLTYWENMQHLRGLVKMLCGSLDTFEMARMEDLQEEYILNHPIEFFMSYRNPRKHKAKVQPVVSHESLMTMKALLLQTRTRPQ